MELDPTVAAAGFRLSFHETLASTNAEALARSRGDEAGRLWIVASQQTAGRGRRGREWISVPGNLYATLLLLDPAVAEKAPELSFVAGLAVHDAIVDRAPELHDKLALKWPNDVLYAGRKLAGILIEGELIKGDNVGTRLAVAVGIGVNCTSHPAPTRYPATDLAAAGGIISSGSLFSMLSNTMMRRLEQWNAGAGFHSIRRDWLERAFGIESEIQVRLPEREINGRFETVDASGRLLLRLADGSQQRIAAGEIFPISGYQPVGCAAQMGRPD